MTPSKNFFKVLAELEGVKLKAYLDSAKIPTIGIGTIRYPDGTPVKITDTCTLEQANEYANNDVKKFSDTLNDILKGLNCTQNMYDAMLLLMYNIGARAFAKSTVLKMVMQGQGDIKTAWLMWNKAGGKIVPGLINRRNKEIQLFFS